MFAYIFMFWGFFICVILTGELSLIIYFQYRENLWGRSWRVQYAQLPANFGADRFGSL